MQRVHQLTENDQATVERLADNFDHLDAELTVGSSIEICGRLREQPGLASTDNHGGFYVLGRYNDVVEVQRQAGATCPAISYAEGILHPMNGQPKGIPIDFDAPEHRVWRKLFTNVLDRAAVERFAPTLLEEITGVVDDFLAKGGGNFAVEVARALPLAVIGRMIGWSDAVSEKSRELIDAMMTEFGTGQFGAHTALIALLDHEVKERQREPRDDYLTELVSSEVFDRPITDAELTNTLLTFLFAGYESTAQVIGSAMVSIVSDQELQGRLRDDPALIPALLEECVRLYPPVHVQFRTVTRDSEIGGVPLASGSRIGVAWAAANRDPAKFDEPDDIRLDRPNLRAHVGYGFGAHLCAGVHLARAEMLFLFQQLLGSGHRFEFEGSARHGGMQMAHDSGWEDIPVRCVAIDDAPQSE